ncbi:MAG TPA: adenylyltransferase/cytidyltransferase family protein [Limnochorda sp.]
MNRQDPAQAAGMRAGAACRIFDLWSFEAVRRELEAQGVRLALTNGCFDLLHPGHLHLLQVAKSQADRLVVGLNTDGSVRSLKGPERPIQPAAHRALLLAALRPVDYVVLFGDRHAHRLLEVVRPHVYVKGGDYTPETLPEAPTARRLGIELLLVEPRPGLSTTGLARRAGASG